MAAPHAILDRTRVPGDGLFLMQRRARPRENSDEFEENTRHLMDEMFPLSGSLDLTTRRAAVQSIEDDSQSIDSDFSLSVGRGHDSDEDMHDEPSLLFSLEQPQTVEDDEHDSSSMSLELRPSQEEDADHDDEDPTAAAASSSSASAAAAASSSSASSSSASAAAASSSSAASRQNSMVWSELAQPEEEVVWSWEVQQTPELDSWDPNPPFVPPLPLPPLETPEQIEAREGAERQARNARLAEITEQHAIVARQRLMQIQGEEQAARQRSQGNPPDIANLAPARGRMTVSTMHSLANDFRSKELGDPFYFMQPAAYTKETKFRLTGRTAQRLIWMIKLDGNRALWDGWNQLLISKTSRIKIKPPYFWRDLMPRNCYLDGELFVPSEKRVNGTNTEFAAALYQVAPVWRISRDSIKRQASAIRDNDWLKFQFHAFDIVGAKLNDKPLSFRLGVLEATLRQFEHSHPTERPVFRRVYTDNLVGTTTAEVHRSVESLLTKYGKGLGAEGIVIKDLNSPYHHTSPNPRTAWIKAKYYEDLEALIVEDDITTAKGEKAVRIQLPDQQETKQVVIYANGKLISERKLKKGMIVSVAFMPDRNSESDKIRTPIIRSIIEDGTFWIDIIRRQREKEEEARRIRW